MLRNLIALILIGLITAFSYVFNITRDLPPVEKVLRDGINPTQWTQIFASDGTPIMSFGKFQHENVRLKSVSPYFLDALIATEDRRFYQHHGVDPIAVFRAVVSDLTHKRLREGGSTITQQLARNVFLNNERSMARKVREAALAIQLEDKLSKEQILELYINNVYFGEGAYGIKAASQIYFGKPPSRLNLAEAALLAGLPQAPSGYNPFQNLEGARRRRDEVLQNLVEINRITPEQAARFKAQAVHLNPYGRSLASADKAPFFNRYVMTQIMRYFNLDEQSFWQSGLKIYTTLDLHGQMLAERAVLSSSNMYGRTRPMQQAALVSINPRTGAILAYVGGKDFHASQFDRVNDAVRSPGSLFKVFTYTAAIDHGYEPTRVYLDAPMQVGNWRPQNYDRSHHGYMTIARALITSNNIVAVKVIRELGTDSVVRMAEQMGIRTPMAPYLGLTLGGSGVKLLDITSAFGTLANQGVRVEPHAIEKVVDDAGREIYREHPVRNNVLNRTTVDTMVKMMIGVIERGTGHAAAIGRPVAGKTGTSDDHHDAWLVAFTPDVVTGVWVGNDNNAPMPGMTGGALPAIIWKAFMQPYLAGRPALPFDLAYSKPLDEKDFITYNLRNLSGKNDPVALAPTQSEEEASPPPDNGAPESPEAPVAPSDTAMGDARASEEEQPQPRAPRELPPLQRNEPLVRPQPALPPDPVSRPPEPVQQQPFPGYGEPPSDNRSGRSG